MAFTNTLGRVSRHGAWRFRHVFRASAADGRVDTSDNGLIYLGQASDIVLTVNPRPPYAGFGRCGCDEPAPVLSASLSAGTLALSDPSFIEAVFPAGWSGAVPPGLYDVRVAVTILGEEAVILDEPVEIR